MLTLLRLPPLAPPSRAFACSAFIVAALQLVVCAQRFPSLPSKPEQICLVAAAERQSERSELFLAVELEAARKARGARRGQTRCPDISAWACRRASEEITDKIIAEVEARRLP